MDIKTLPNELQKKLVYIIDDLNKTERDKRNKTYVLLTLKEHDFFRDSRKKNRILQKEY